MNRRSLSLSAATLAVAALLTTGLGQALGIANADVLRPAIRMMNQAAAMNGPTVVDGLLESIQHEAGVGGAADTPAQVAK